MECGIFPWKNLVIADNQVLAKETALSEVREILSALTCKQLIGSAVVSDNGKLLGRILEVYLTLHTHKAIYQIAGTGLRGILTRTGFIPGDVPSFYSCRGLRMIVPAGQSSNATPSI